MHTEIIVVLDRSGSMGSIAGDVVGGFDQFIKEQREAPGTANLTLVQFDTGNPFELVYTRHDVRTVEPLVFQPRGGTPLLDAIGRTLNWADHNVVHDQTPSSCPQCDTGPEKARYVLVVITDGHENASKEFNRGQVFDMIEHRRKQHDWQVTFLAANMDAIQEGGSLGFSAVASLNFAHTGQGIRRGLQAMSRNTALYRSTGAAIAYSKEERDAADPHPTTSTDQTS